MTWLTRAGAGMVVTVVHSGALGDTVLLMPLLRALRVKYPDGRINLVMRSAFGQILVHLGVADAFFSSDDRAAVAWFSDAPSDSAPPPWAACDMLLSAVSNGEDAWARNASRYSTATWRGYFEPRPPDYYPHHVTQYHRDQLWALQLPHAPVAAPRKNQDGPVLIHPGSGGSHKRWPLEHYVALARALREQAIPVVFLLGEVEMEWWDRKVIAAYETEFRWELHLSLIEFLGKLQGARAFVGNDSGPSHLAAAVGIPTLALFGPTNIGQWHPIGPQVKLLQAPRGDLFTLREETVLQALLELDAATKG